MHFYFVADIETVHQAGAVLDALKFDIIGEDPAIDVFICLNHEFPGTECFRALYGIEFCNQFAAYVKSHESLIYAKVSFKIHFPRLAGPVPPGIRLTLWEWVEIFFRAAFLFYLGRYLIAMRRLFSAFLPFFFLAISGCHPGYHPTGLQYAGYDINNKEVDTAFTSFIKPYAAKVGETMNDVVGELPTALAKSLPDGSLNNFLADAYLSMARARFDASADLAYMNFGGIRLNSIQAGPLKRGSVYEVMPFDNLMVLVKVKGSVLKEFLDHVAAEGGGGISGVVMRIREKKATDIQVQGQALDPEKEYTMVNSDYVVNGGGGFRGFRDLPARTTGYLLRDAILDYCKQYQTAGKPVPVPAEKRIVHDRP